MILADKIIQLRKKNGWSQEELAEKLQVSRQAVSKWEATQTTPDLDKILKLSNLFGVTTDYLLKDELEEAEFLSSADDLPLRKISLSEANDYLQQRWDSAVKIAVATALCILSVIPLFLLLGLSSLSILPLAETTAAGIGVVAIFPFIAVAVWMFVRTGFRNAPYEFLENEPFETEYGVTGLAKERQKSYRSTYVNYNCIGVCCCVLAPIPILCGAFSANEHWTLLLLCVTFLMAAIGVMFLIIAGVRWESTKKLLKEGEYAPSKQKRSKLMNTIADVYWLAATAIYLGWSFLTKDWGITWVLWPIAGILYAGIEVLCNFLLNKDDPSTK